MKHPPHKFEGKDREEDCTLCKAPLNHRVHTDSFQGNIRAINEQLARATHPTEGVAAPDVMAPARITRWDLSDAERLQEVALTPAAPTFVPTITHAHPAYGTDASQCCGKTAKELNADDRWTLRPEDVTCAEAAGEEFKPPVFKENRLYPQFKPEVHVVDGTDIKAGCTPPGQVHVVDSEVYGMGQFGIYRAGGEGRDYGALGPWRRNDPSVSDFITTAERTQDVPELASLIVAAVEADRKRLLDALEREISRQEELSIGIPPGTAARDLNHYTDGLRVARDLIVRTLDPAGGPLVAYTLPRQCSCGAVVVEIPTGGNLGNAVRD